MRANRTQCRILKRCLLCFTAISLLPFALIYLITSDQIYRVKNYDFGNDTTDQTSPEHPVKLSQSEMEMVETRMNERVKHMTEKCAFYGLDQKGNDSLHRPNPWEYLINKKHHLVWCNVFKAASTSWMYNFNLLAGYSPQFLKKTNMVPLSLARKKYPRPTIIELNEALNNSISFLIVRHPFERLLSAYRDKIQYALPHTFHQKLGAMIVRKYRKKSKTKKYGTRWPSFPEFVNYLLSEYRAGHDLDMHWSNIVSFCTPCQLRFDVIAKFETLEEDQTYLIEKAGLGNLIKPQWKNPGKGKNTQELLMKYYSQLTKYQIKGLYEMFKYDFELFEYNPAEYIKMGLDKDEDEDFELANEQKNSERGDNLVLHKNRNNNNLSNKVIEIFAVE